MNVTLEYLQSLMDEYGDIRYKLEDLKSSKETALKRILEKYPEAAQELSELEEELNGQIEQAEELEKRKKKFLQVHVDEYAKSIPLKDKGEVKSNLIRIGLERKVTYDPVGLDGMAMSDTRLLAFRKESISTRITLNSK